MLYKRIQSYLEPLDGEAYELMNSLAVNAMVAFDKVIKPRNYKFLQKFHTLIKFAFEHWQPGELSGKQFEGVTPKKSITRFRKDVTILAGFFEQEIRLDGSIRTTAKSISFASMEEDDFEELYNNTINVILERVLTNYDREQLDKVVLELLSFD